MRLYSGSGGVDGGTDENRKVLIVKNPKRQQRFFTKRRSDGACEKACLKDVAASGVKSATTSRPGGLASLRGDCEKPPK